MTLSDWEKIGPSAGRLWQKRNKSDIFDFIFEFTSDLLALTDHSGQMLRRSNSFDAAFRIPESTQATMSVSDFLNEKSQHDYKTILAYILRERKPVIDFKLRMNSSLPMSALMLTASLINSTDTKRTVVLHLFRKEHSKFPSSLDFIEKLTNIGQIAAGMAHELNTPLGAIILSAGMINETTNQEEVTLESASIMDRAMHCSRVVRDLLSYVHRDEKTFKSYPLADILQKVIGLVSKEAERRNIALDVVRSDGVISIRCDENQIEQLFFNLLTNSFHAIDKDGSVKITFRRDELLNQVIVKLTDTGKGISPENLGVIFDPFFTTKPSGQGTGLGLALCKKIVYEHNGTIRAISRLGEGTTFEIALPLEVQ